MDCQRTKKLINPYIDGILDKDVATQIKAHLQTCPDCRKEYVAMKEVVSSLNILASIPVSAPAALTRDIMEKITKEEVRIQTSWLENLNQLIAIPKLSFRFVSSAVAATAAVIFFAFIFLFNAPAVNPICSSEVRFSLKFEDQANHSVAIAGDFNGWNPKGNILEDPDGDGVWTGTLNLKPGRYEYMFVLDDEIWVPDPNSLRFVKDGFGNRNSILEINSCSSST